jgi:hypothetical protein
MEEKMKASILFENIWSDSDIVELKITVDDGNSSFCNRIYASYVQIHNIVIGLDEFKNHIYGGLFNFELGEFGPEFANGAFYGRLHFGTQGKIYISTKQQTEYFDFGRKNVASESNLYVISEPALLDNFIEQFRTIDKEVGNAALLECI